MFAIVGFCANLSHHFYHYLIHMRAIRMDETSEMVRRARCGDKEAFGALAQQHLGMLIRLAAQMTSDYEIAQELAQEAILQAYLSLRQLRDNALFRSWLYGIGINICRSYLRARKAAPLSLEDLMGGMRHHGSVLFDSSLTVEEIVEVQELHQRLLDALDALTSADREAVLLFYYHDMSIREAAILLDTSPGALRVRLHKARRHLRQQLLATESANTRVMEAQIMFPVEVLEVIYLKQDNQELPDLKYPIILLLDEPNERVLPIWIGPHEGEIIQLLLNNATFPRPMTWSFMSNLLAAVGAQVESVIVSKLVGETYYAITKLRFGDVVHEVDARPSDAIGLALNTQAPIFVAEDVMSKTSIQMGTQFKAGLAERHRMSRIASEAMAQRFSPSPLPTEAKLPSQAPLEAVGRKAKEQMKAIIGQ